MTKREMAAKIAELEAKNERLVQQLFELAMAKPQVVPVPTLSPLPFVPGTLLPCNPYPYDPIRPFIYGVDVTCDSKGLQ